MKKRGDTNFHPPAKRRINPFHRRQVHEQTGESLSRKTEERFGKVHGIGCWEGDAAPLTTMYVSCPGVHNPLDPV